MIVLAGKYNITVDQGATYSQVFTWKDSNEAPIDLTGYAARMQVRKRRRDDPTLLDLTTENGGITLGSTAGTITVSISADATAAVAAGEHVYDLELVFESTVSRLVMGTFTVRGEITR